MANTASAEKRIRQNANRRERNRGHRSTLRTAVKKLRTLVASGDAAAAAKALPETLSVVDRTAQKGAIHANTAARTKSRLERAVAQLSK